MEVNCSVVDFTDAHKRWWVVFKVASDGGVTLKGAALVVLFVFTTLHRDTVI